MPIRRTSTREAPPYRGLSPYDLLEIYIIILNRRNSINYHIGSQ